VDMAVRGWANDKESRPRSAKRRSSQVIGAPILKILGFVIDVAETNRLEKG
jgi:predicted aspartyl protease